MLVLRTAIVLVGLSACADHHFGTDDAGALADAGADGGSDAGSDAGPPPDPFAGCTRTGPNATGTVGTPLGEVTGRQAWLWTWQDWESPGPTYLVVNDIAEVTDRYEERTGALQSPGDAPAPGELTVSIGAEEGGVRRATLWFRSLDGELVSTEDATIELDAASYEAGHPISGLLRSSAPGWSVELSFELLHCAHLARICLC